MNPYKRYKKYLRENDSKMLTAQDRADLRQFLTNPRLSDDDVSNKVKQLSADDSLYEDYDLNGATDIVRVLYDKFPKLAFLDERDLDDNKVALFFKYTPGLDTGKLEDWLESNKVNYKISNGKVRIIAVEDDDSLYEDYENSEDYDDDFRFVVKSYYGSNYSGLEDDLSTNDYKECVDFLWEKLNAGCYCVFRDSDTGEEYRLDPDNIDDYYYEGEFDFGYNPIKNESVSRRGRRNRRMYESASDIESKCRAKFKELQNILSGVSPNEDAIQAVQEAFKAVGGTCKISNTRSNDFRYSGSVGKSKYTVSGYVSSRSFQSDLYRLAEDLTMAYNVSLGGERGSTPSFIRRIMGESFRRNKGRKFLESNDGGLSYSEAAEILADLTDRGKKPEGTITTYYESEKYTAVKILKRFYDIVEVSDGRMSKGEPMSWVIAYARPKRKSKPKTESLKRKLRR